MENILALAIPFLAAFVLVKFFVSQIGCLWKLVVNTASGFLCLWLLNLASGFTGIVLEINLFTCLFTGFLGIPGIILLVLGRML